MAEPGIIKNSAKVQSLPNVKFVPLNERISPAGERIAATKYKKVPTGESVNVRSNRTARETLDQYKRMFDNYGVITDRMNRAYNRTMNAMIAKNRWNI